MSEYYMTVKGKRLKISEATWNLYRSGKFRSYIEWKHYLRESNGSVIDCYVLIL